MVTRHSHWLVVATRDGECTVTVDGISMLAGCHNNVRKLFRKLTESAGTPLDYDYLERDLYQTEPRGPQGAYNTKNAVRSLRSALFPQDPPDGQQKWQSAIRKNGKVLMRLEKPHASRICLVFPQPSDDPDVLLDIDIGNVQDGSPGLRLAPRPPFTVPSAHSNHFFGRDGILMELHDRLISANSACVAICGSGGMGKTQTAVEYSHFYRDSYPGGVFWIDAKDAESVTEEYARLSSDIDSLRTPQDLSMPERARRVRDRLHQFTEPALLILDSLVPDDKLMHMLPVTGPCRILATTRSQAIPTSRFQIVALPELDKHSSLLALQAGCTVEQTADRLTLREPDSSYTEALRREQDALEGICDDRNMRLPLTLTLIASYVYQRKTTFEECRRRLEADSLKVYERAVVDYSIHAAFKISRSEFSPEALRVLAGAASFARQNVSQELLRLAVSITDTEVFEDAIAVLDRSSLIHLDSRGRVTVHDLVRDMTLEQIDPAERAELLDGTAAALAGAMNHANERMQWDHVRWEVVQIRAVIETCRRLRRHLPLAGLLFELGHYYRLQDQTELALQHLDEAARTVAAYAPENLRMLANCKLQMSATEPFARSAVTNARSALAIARANSGYSLMEMSEFHNAIGYALKMNGHPRRALPFYCRALDLCGTETGRQSGPAGEYLNNLGALYEDVGEYRKAAECVLEAYEILSSVYGSRHRLSAITLNTLGRIQLRLGEPHRALESHQSARQVFQEVSGSETKDYAMSLFFIAAALAALGCAEESRKNVADALELLERKYGPEDPAARRVRRTFESDIF